MQRVAEDVRGYAHRIDAEASVQWVWRGLIDPQLMTDWYGTNARVTPKRGGSYWVQVERGLEREAHIDVFEPNRRLRLIYMPPRQLPGADVVIVDDFILDTEGDCAVLRLLGTGIPKATAWDGYYQRLRGGWALWLARLKVCAEQHAKGKVPMRTRNAGRLGNEGRLGKKVAAPTTAKQDDTKKPDDAKSAAAKKKSQEWELL